MTKKITLQELINYASVNGKESAVNLMLLLGPHNCDFENDLYEDVIKVLELDDKEIVK